jgi:hypothetical protein
MCNLEALFKKLIALIKHRELIYKKLELIIPTNIKTNNVGATILHVRCTILHNLTRKSLKDN